MFFEHVSCKFYVISDLKLVLYKTDESHLSNAQSNVKCYGLCILVDLLKTEITCFKIMRKSTFKLGL